MSAALRRSAWVVAGAAILLLPAIWFGRPFVFYDTPAYWGWGRDIFEALLRPWPHAGQPWIAGRPLHGWEIGAHGATSGDLRFTLTLLTARSAFYAVPFYLLTRAGGLWLVAGLQCLIASWTVQVIARALVPPRAWIGVALLGTLTLTTSLGFEAGYAMPDLFGGLALAAAAAMIALRERLGTGARIGLCAVMVYAALAHAENGLNLAAAAALCALIHFRLGPFQLIARMAPIAGALTAALIIASVGALLLTAAFGHSPRMAPFAASRVLADGAAQGYLRQVCPTQSLAACDLADGPPAYADYYLGIYPLAPPPATTPSDFSHAFDQVQFRHVSDAEADHRDRFVAEQPKLVLGAIRTDGAGLTATALASGGYEFVNFAVDRDFDSLAGLTRERTQRRDQTVAFTPAAAGCTAGGHACAPLDLGVLASVQRLVVWASFATIALGCFRRVDASAADLRTFMGASVLLVLANALICGGLSGAYDRYQARVEWLIPFCAFAQLAEWALQRTAARRAEATLRSPAAPMVAATNAASQP